VAPQLLNLSRRLDGLDAGAAADRVDAARLESLERSQGEIAAAVERCEKAGLTYEAEVGKKKLGKM
jgi:hypothetical protein